MTTPAEKPANQPRAAGEAAQHIAQIESALAFQRGFYVAEINAGRDHYGNNATAVERSLAAEKEAKVALHSHAALVAALDGTATLLDDPDATPAQKVETARAIIRAALAQAKEGQP